MQNAASSPIRESDVQGPTLEEKVTSTEEKVTALVEKLEQQAALQQQAESQKQLATVEEPEQQPQFEDKLRQLREDIAKNYEDKMNRGFEEIQEMKKDMETRQEIYETQQIRDLRREIKRLQSALLDCQNENIDKEK